MKMNLKTVANMVAATGSTVASTMSKIERPAGVNADLPTLSVWKARSTYLMLLSASAVVGQVFGVDPLALLGVETVEDGAQKIASLASILGPMLLAFRQRAAPHSRLTVN